MARPASKFAVLQADQQEKLYQIWKSHHAHRARMRAHAVLLSSQGYTIDALADIFSVTRDTAAGWIDRFMIGGVEALEDSDRPGAPPLLDEQEQQLLRELFNRYPNRPSKVLAELQKQTGKQMHESTLREYAHRLGLSWKRPRGSMREKRDEKAFQAAREELAELLEEPDLNVVYFDETGFSLKGVMSYGWLPIGERREVPSTRGGVQVLGLQRQDAETNAYVHKGTINSKTVIAVLDDYSEKIDVPTVVVLDNASYHTSKAFESRLNDWAKRGLYVYYLPPYSPELNAIERLWKKLKYHLLPPDAWARFTTLLHTLTNTLGSIGEVVYLPSLHNYTQ